jgi:hypothetical protein
MAKINGKAARSVAGSALSQSSKTRMWTTRNSETGRFVQAKKSGGPFKGVKREN